MSFFETLKDLSVQQATGREALKTVRQKMDKKVQYA